MSFFLNPSKPPIVVLFGLSSGLLQGIESSVCFEFFPRLIFKVMKDFFIWSIHLVFPI